MSCHVGAALQWQLHLPSPVITAQGVRTAPPLTHCKITHLKIYSISLEVLLSSSSEFGCFQRSTLHLHCLILQQCLSFKVITNMAPVIYCAARAASPRARAAISFWSFSFHAPFEPHAISCSHFTLPSHIVL